MTTDDIEVDDFYGIGIKALGHGAKELGGYLETSGKKVGSILKFIGRKAPVVGWGYTATTTHLNLEDAEDVAKVYGFKLDYGPVAIAKKGEIHAGAQLRSFFFTGYAEGTPSTKGFTDDLRNFGADLETAYGYFGEDPAKRDTIVIPITRFGLRPVPAHITEYERERQSRAERRSSDDLARNLYESSRYSARIQYEAARASARAQYEKDKTTWGSEETAKALAERDLMIANARVIRDIKLAAARDRKDTRQAHAYDKYTGGDAQDQETAAAIETGVGLGQLGVTKGDILSLPQASFARANELTGVLTGIEMAGEERARIDHLETGEEPSGIGEALEAIDAYNTGAALAEEGNTTAEIIDAYYDTGFEDPATLNAMTAGAQSVTDVADAPAPAAPEPVTVGVGTGIGIVSGGGSLDGYNVDAGVSDFGGSGDFSGGSYDGDGFDTYSP